MARLKPYCVGLTGGVASGKSRVAAQLSGCGAGIVDTDLLARELVAPGEPALAEIAAAFGASVLRADGSLDRASLRALVFAEPTARQRLETILHPRIRALAVARVKECPAPYVVLVVPLLAEHFETYRPLLDRVLVVDCPATVQRARLMARDGLSEAEANAMLAAQIDRTQRLAIADDRFDNSANIAIDEAELIVRIAELHARYMAYAQQNIPTDVAIN